MIRQGWPYFEGWPFQERWLQIDGLGIHYVDEGYGSRPVVMVDGNPAWSYMWRSLIPAISSVHQAMVLGRPTVHGFVMPGRARRTRRLRGCCAMPIIIRASRRWRRWSTGSLI